MAKVITCVRKLPPHLFLCHVLYPFSKYSCTTMTWFTYTKNNNTTLDIFWFFSCAGDTNILKHTRSWMHVLMLKGYCHVYKLDLSPLEVLWDWLFSHRALSWSKLVVFEIWIMIIIIFTYSPVFKVSYILYDWNIWYAWKEEKEDKREDVWYI